MLLITCADDYLGYCITSHLSQSAALRPDMRVLCQETNASLPWLRNFAKRGIDVLSVNYEHPNDLSNAMRNVDQVILIMSNHPNRVEHSRHVYNVASKSGVKSIIFLSHQGAQSEQHSALYDYGLVENHLVSMQQQQQDMSWVILRLEFIQQYFHLWSHQVEVTGNMTLPLNSDTELCPIDITDVCAVISAFVVQQDGTFTACLNEYHAGQVYTLTGPEAVNGKSLVSMMSDATTYKLHRYLMVRPMDTVYYLTDLRRNIWFDERLKKERSAVYMDQEEFGYRTKALCLPNDIQIQTFLDYFDWTNKTLGSVQVDHVEVITKEKPRALQAYFCENSISFKPRV
ncbi:hypothetical protein HMPREF1544_07838 [Mucor circinelloides 1006PhL]|uniref:NAD(P)-binding domain-containing protein n=1 Tax=Mucor circinelloides f. circinelloides (strain 1006PhL) TaxID=1220926 RepID=S2JRY5_MUCC1|nr:hypothetical protein HMPREF1544_07838 [Mucor circinelloides 1006PhL]